MITVTERARVPVDADRLWSKVGSFGSVGRWHPMLARVDTDGNEPGALRHVQAKDGSTQVERLEECDPARHWYRYSMQQTAMPVAHYGAEFRIDDGGNGASTVTWSASFDVAAGDKDKAEEMVRQFLRAGLEHLSEQKLD